VLSFLPGLSVVYHEHDSPVTIQGSIFLRFCLAARHWLAGRAELCILPNQRRLEKFREETRATSKVACVWNCPRRDEVLSPRYFSQNSALSLYYHGNLSPQLLPPEIINAIADNSYEIRLTVVGYETIGSEGYRFFLQKEAMRLGVSDRVRILAPRPRQELWQYMWECDVGLALFPVTCSNTNLQHLVGASNKVFDYMAAGLALIVSESPDWREMFVMNGYALACDPTNAVSIAATLRWACEHPLEVRAMGERGRQRIAANWNYEAQFAWVRESLF
jgi:glycosyltransferase involved in cell wall biosynthesis